jgi:hypothetical protein
MEMGWVNKQLAIDDRANVELTVVSSNMMNQINAEADTKQPITGLENLLKVDFLDGNKPLVLELEPALFFLMHESRGIRS